MNFRTESFDFPQNEQRRCFSWDMDQREQGWRGESGACLNIPNSRLENGQATNLRAGLVKNFTSNSRRQIQACFNASDLSASSISPRYEITLSIRPYSLASSADMKRSRSVSRSMRSTGWPVCFAISLFICARRWRISLAWISMSDAVPPPPPCEG